MTDEEFIKSIKEITTDELFETLESFGCDGYYRDIWSAILIELNFRIKALEQKTGQWLEKWDSDHLVILAYECSECGMMMNVNTSHYCPNCGIKIESEE